MLRKAVKTMANLQEEANKQRKKQRDKLTEKMKAELKKAPPQQSAYQAKRIIINQGGAGGGSSSNGLPGVGVPVGGAAGQVLTKATAADYDTGWVDPLAENQGALYFAIESGYLCLYTMGTSAPNVELDTDGHLYWEVV
jgi:hypothetical protein